MYTRESVVQYVLAYACTIQNLSSNPVMQCINFTTQSMPLYYSTCFRMLLIIIGVGGIDSRQHLIQKIIQGGTKL